MAINMMECCFVDGRDNLDFFVVPRRRLMEGEPTVEDDGVSSGPLWLPLLLVAPLVMVPLLVDDDSTDGRCILHDTNEWNDV